MKLTSWIPRHVFVNYSWYLSERAIRLGGVFLISAWVARYLGPAQFGTLNFAIALVTMLAFISSLGLESLIIRDIVQSPSQDLEVLSSYLLIRLIGSTLIPPIATIYVLFSAPEDTTLLLITVILAFGTLLSSFDAVDCYLQAKHKAKTTTIIRTLGFVTSSLLKISLILTKSPLVFFAVASLVELAITAFFYLKLALSIGVKLSPRNQWKEMISIISDGKLMILSGLTVIIYSKIDLLIIGEKISKIALGNYAAAITLYSAWNVVGTSLTQAYAPLISSSKQKSESEYILILRNFLLLNISVSIMGSIFLYLISPYIFSLLFGKEFQLSSEIFSTLVWASIPVFLGVASSQIIINEKIYWISLTRTFIGMLVMLSLIVPVIKHWNVQGVAWLVLVSGAIATLSILLSSKARSIIVKIFER